MLPGCADRGHVAVCDAHGNVLYVARFRDTDELAVLAATKRGVQLPRYIVICRNGTEPKHYEVVEGGVIVATGQKTAP